MLWPSLLWNSAIPLVLAQVAAEPAAPVAPEGMSPVIKLLISVAAIIGSFVAGSMIARSLRLPDMGGRIGLVLFTLVASLVVIALGWPPKRGIDLSGGVVLVYEVDRSSTQPSWMQTAVSNINEELNADGGEKLEARPISGDQIQIDVPEGVNVSRVEEAVQRLAKRSDVQLHIDSRKVEKGQTSLVYRLAASQQQAVDMPKLIAAVSRRINPSGVKELTIRQYGGEQLEIIIPEVEEREVDQIKHLISTSGVLEFRIVANENDHKDIIKAAQKTPGRDVYLGGKPVGRWVKAKGDINPDTYPWATFRPTKQGFEVLLAIDPFDVTGRYLRRATSSIAEGRPSVDFSFYSDGGAKFGQLTSRNLPDHATEFYRHLGIVLDNELLSAPRINSTIHDQGQITGNFTQDEVDSLVSVLNAGSLPATLRQQPISQQRISSQLGDDTIRKGSLAMIISTGAILLFMLVYYRFCGMVANVAVILNMIVTVALMILVKAAFTLPGLAGMVLTVGMAVDANVLIYERMREEMERGASLRMAIRNGFSRAMATIIDSHVTTLVSAVVLFVVGTDQIRGFAVTLIIGLLMSLFTAVYVARVLFDIAERTRWLKQLKMMHVIGHTNIDFIRWLAPAVAVSVLLTVLGGVAAVMRGKELLDIDFTGGSSVQLVFAKGKEQDIADVRRVVGELTEELPDVAVSTVGVDNREFKIDTSNRDIADVQKTLQKVFGSQLQTYEMSFGSLSPITAAEKKPAADGTDASVESATPAGDAKPDATPAPEAKTPEEKPAAAPAPEATKPEGEKPAAEPAQPETPPAEKPAAEAPKQAQLENRSAIQLAGADREAAIAALLVSQQEPAAEAAAQDTKQPEPAKTDAAPAETPKAEPPAAEADNAAKEGAAKEEAAKDEAAKTDSAAAKSATEASVETPATTPADSLIGGTRVTLNFPQSIGHGPLTQMVQRELEKLQLKDTHFELRNPEYQAGSDARYSDWTLDVLLNHEQTEALVKGIQTDVHSSPVFPSSSEIGGKVAGDTQLMALYALLASMAIIVVYIWIRFQNVIFGLAAVLALVHDVAITIAFLAASYYLSPYLGFMLVDPFKVSLPVVAALLTIVGFSINDTIVVFDRIREVRGKSPELTPEMINLSVNQTLSRTLLTSGTVLIASVILYFVGGPGIHAFAFSMVVGVVAGTYSSIYIAAPVLLWMKRPAGEPNAGALAASARR